MEFGAVVLVTKQRTFLLILNDHYVLSSFTFVHKFRFILFFFCVCVCVGGRICEWHCCACVLMFYVNYSDVTFSFDPETVLKYMLEMLNAVKYTLYIVGFEFSVSLQNIAFSSIC